MAIKFFNIRTTRPENGNPYYNRISNGGYQESRDPDPHNWTSGLDCLPNCTGYAIGRFNEIHDEIIGDTTNRDFYFFRGDASNFPSKSNLDRLHLKKSSKPAPGAIACRTSGKYGHVAVVEKVFSDGQIAFTEGKYGVTVAPVVFASGKGPASDWDTFILQPVAGIPSNEVIEIAKQAATKIGVAFNQGTFFNDLPKFTKTLKDYEDELVDIVNDYSSFKDINDYLNSLKGLEETSQAYINSIDISSTGYQYTNDPPKKVDYPAVYYNSASPITTFEDEDTGKNVFAKFYPNIQLNFGSAENPEEITLEQITKRKDQWSEDTITKINVSTASNIIKQVLANTENVQRINSNPKGLSGKFQIPSDTIVGFTPTDLTYTGELVANVGETITSVLDKIVEFLNNDYEYFYNTDGQFVFRKKLTGVQLNYEVDKEDKSVRVKSSTNYSPEVFPLEDSRLIISINNNPDFANVKNDFSVWGSRDVNDTQIPIHYRCAIDKKPEYYKTLERLVPRYFTLDTEKEIIETLVRRFSEILTEKEQNFESHLNKCLNAFTSQSQEVENAYLSLLGKYDTDPNSGDVEFKTDSRLTDLVSVREGPDHNNHPYVDIKICNVDSQLQDQTPVLNAGLNYFMFLFNYLYYESIGKPKGMDPEQQEDIYDNAFFVPRDVRIGEPLVFGVPLFKWEGDKPFFDTQANIYKMKYIDTPLMKLSPNEMRYSAEQKQSLLQLEKARIEEIWARNAAKYNRDIDKFKQDYQDIQDGRTTSSLDGVNLQTLYECSSLAELQSLDLWPQEEPVENIRLSMLAKRLVLKPRPATGSSATEEEVLEDAKKYNFFVYGKKSGLNQDNESPLINGVMKYLQNTQNTRLKARRTRLLSNIGVEYNPNTYADMNNPVGGTGTYILKGNGIIDKFNNLKIKKDSTDTLKKFQSKLPKTKAGAQELLQQIAQNKTNDYDLRTVFMLLNPESTLKTRFDLSTITTDIFQYLDFIWMPVLPLLDGGVFEVLNQYFNLTTNTTAQLEDDNIISDLTNRRYIRINNDSIINTADSTINADNLSSYMEDLYKDLQILFNQYRTEIGNAFTKVKQQAAEIRDYVISQIASILRDEVYKDIKAIKTAYAKDQWIHKGSLIYTTNEDLANESNTYVVDWREIIWQMAEDYNKSNKAQIPNWLGDADFLWKIAKNNPNYYPTGKTGYEQYYIDVHDNLRDLYEECYIYNTEQDCLSYSWKQEGIKNNKFNPVYEESVRRLIDIPETLNFWFDFIDGEDNSVSQFSVPAIGRRPKFVNDNNVKVINNEEVPQLLFVPIHYIAEDTVLGKVKPWSYKINTYEDITDMDEDTSSEDITYIDEDAAGDVLEEQLIQVDLDQTKLDYPDFRVIQVSDDWFIASDTINGGFYPTGSSRSAKAVIESWLSQYTYCGETLNLTALPIYTLKPNTEIYIKDEETGTNGLYLIKTVSIPLAYNGTMSISCTKQVRNIK